MLFTVKKVRALVPEMLILFFKGADQPVHLYHTKIQS